MVDIKVRGLSELRKELREIPFRLQKNALRIAVQEAAKVFAAEVEASTPVWAGYLSPKRQREYPRGALRASVKAKRRRATRLQVRSTVDMVFYGRFLEKGWNLTSRRKSKSGKKIIRHIPPHPFVLPAFMRAKDRAVEVIKDAVRREIVNQPVKAQARARAKLARIINAKFASDAE